MHDKQIKAVKNLRVTSQKSLSMRKLFLIVACILLSATTFGGTLAYIFTNTTPLTNKFVPAQMRCEILEDFSNGTVKQNVCVQNTGDASAYIRVKLLPYWYDKEIDTIIAKSSWTPLFTPGAGWVCGNDGYYYYTSPVNPGECTSVLISSLTLEQDEISLARQVLEVIASCIQAEPVDAVMEAWSGENGSVTGVSDNTLQVSQGGISE